MLFSHSCRVAPMQVMAKNHVIGQTLSQSQLCSSYVFSHKVYFGESCPLQSCQEQRTFARKTALTRTLHLRSHATTPEITHKERGCTSEVEGMLAPSATSLTPALTSRSASAFSTSFWVAHGSAMSNLVGTSHGLLPATNLPAHTVCATVERPRSLQRTMLQRLCNCKIAVTTTAQHMHVGSHQLTAGEKNGVKKPQTLDSGRIGRKICFCPGLGQTPKTLTIHVSLLCEA